MGKNIKKTIHVSCLVSLLFTCNKTIGKNGTTQEIIPYVCLGEDDATEALVPYVHLGENDTTEALVPYVHICMSLPIGEALEELKKLMKQKEERLIDTQKTLATDRRTYNKIKKTLHAYNKGLKIHINNRKDGTLMGICDTKGWHKDEDIKQKMADVKHKLALLAIPNLKLDESESPIKTHKILEVERKK